MTQEEVQALVELGETATRHPLRTTGGGRDRHTEEWLPYPAAPVPSPCRALKAAGRSAPRRHGGGSEGRARPDRRRSGSRLGRWTVEQAHYLVRNFDLPFLAAVARTASTPDGSFQVGGVDLSLSGIGEAESDCAAGPHCRENRRDRGSQSAEATDYRFRDGGVLISSGCSSRGQRFPAAVAEADMQKRRGDIAPAAGVGQYRPGA